MPYIKPDPKARKSKTSAGTVAKKAVSGTKNYIRDEMLGFDDFGRVASKSRSGNFLGAAKSAATGVGELGLTAASVAAGFFSGGTGAVAIQGAKMGAKEAVKAGVKEATKTAVKTTAATAASKAANKASTTASKPGGFIDDVGSAIKGGIDDITKKFWIPKPPGGTKGPQFKDDGWNPYGYVPAKKPPLKPMDTGGGRVPRGTTVTEAPPSSMGVAGTPKNFDTPFNPYSPKINPWPGMPKVKPAAPKPAPAPKPKVKPQPTKPQVNPSTAPDAAKPALKTSVQTKPELKTQTQVVVKPSVKPITKTQLKPNNRVPIRIPVMLDDGDDENKPDRWVPSALV